MSRPVRQLPRINEGNESLTDLQRKLKDKYKIDENKYITPIIEFLNEIRGYHTRDVNSSKLTKNQKEDEKITMEERLRKYKEMFIQYSPYTPLIQKIEEYTDEEELNNLKEEFNKLDIKYQRHMTSVREFLNSFPDKGNTFKPVVNALKQGRTFVVGGKSTKRTRKHKSKRHSRRK
jgi:hypothetical protein